MFAEGIFPIGDGLLDIDEERLKGLLVPDDINEIYDVEQAPFARGKFAAVRRAIHKKSGVHFAAKFLKRRRRAQSSDKEIKHEIAVLMLCNEADNIVKLNAVHESRSDTALLLELATGGELQTFLDNEECLNEAQARICMREVLKALQFLHKRSIVHLDLKPQNILLAGERVEDGLKLCDFGISRFVTEGTNVREIVGTPDYVAPEVLQYEPLSLSTDIWSVGVLSYVLLSGFSPFGGETKQETFLNISQCALTFPDKLFGGVSSAAIDFIRKALRIKPNDRMTAAGCLEHIWLKDECNIDRHIFNNKLSNKQQLEHDDDDDDDEDDDDDGVNSDDHASNADAEEDNEEDDVGVDVDVDVDEDQEITEVNHDIDEDDEVVDEVNVKDIPEAISVDNSEEEDDVLTSSTSFNKYNTSTTANGQTNGHLNGYTNGHMNGHLTNGHVNGLTNGHANGFAKTSSKLLNGSPKTSAPSSTTTNTTTIPNSIPTTKTTVVHNVPATKAITIPLGSVQPPQKQHCIATPTSTATTTPPQEQHQQQLQQQQQFLHIPARRQSSESNKENTFLTTKKIAPSPSSGIKKPHSTVTQSNTTTATIVINPSGHMAPGHIVATITLPTAAVTPPACSSVNVTNEKLINVIATNTATTNSFFPDAPTTPKVIRKAPNSDTSPTSVKALVKKFQLEGGEQPLNPPEFATNGSKQHHVAMMKANETKTKFINGRPSLQNPPTTHSTAITINNTSRRASEPIAAIHTTKKLGGMTSSSAPVSIPPLASNSFKTSCVYCNSCNAATNSAGLTSITAANGCRHPSSTTTVHVNNKNGAPTASCSATFSQSTKSLINGSSSNGSLTSSSSSNGTNTSTSSNALLFGGNHQHQHHLLNSHHAHHHGHGHHAHTHHHHHHHLHHHGKSGAGAAANGLSLDQGIIC